MERVYVQMTVEMVFPMYEQKLHVTITRNSIHTMEVVQNMNYVCTNHVTWTMYVHSVLHELCMYNICYMNYVCTTYVTWTMYVHSVLHELLWVTTRLLFAIIWEFNIGLAEFWTIVVNKLSVILSIYYVLVTFLFQYSRFVLYNIPRKKNGQSDLLCYLSETFIYS